MVGAAAQSCHSDNLTIKIGKFRESYGGHILKLPTLSEKNIR